MSGKNPKKSSNGGKRKSLIPASLDALRKLGAPEGSRPAKGTPPAARPTSSTQPPVRDAAPKGIQTFDSALLATTATSLWYLKTKFFRKEWGDVEPTDDDPRVRKALARLEKGMDALRSIGLVVEDPTRRRYSAGSESMKAIQIEPTESVTFEVVTETVQPVVYLGDRLIQRGEVFVAVPVEPTAAPQPPGQNP
ncbi:MAG TPA: hypothetical protein PKO15_04640 [Fibrobacteria bacterium]|nr:hypothetical protein [Fibrobacteria bacterium]HOX53574.1 hypothetical protein [Fibrobacteria bacterium]